MTTYTATYSPEDNKLRLYASERLDDDIYQQVRDHGFRWAPKQELFVAPSWSPSREDFLLSLTDTIEPEDTTLLERAEAKAARLDDLAIKRHEQANAFAAAANNLNERFSYGQPILVGHHSERKARKDKDRAERAEANAQKAAQAVDYWQYRATGVERHANYKNNPRTIERRIKTLLKDLRTQQRTLNQAGKDFDMYSHFLAKGAISKDLVSNMPGLGVDRYYRLKNDEITPIEALQSLHDNALNILTGPNRRRILAHILNRIGYEQSQLPPIPRYAGDITPAILQTFAREHGADKPKAVKTPEGFILASSVALPLHIHNGNEKTATVEEWRGIMQACGYQVPDKAPAKPPILNFKADILNRDRFGKTEVHTQIALTKAEYSAIHADYRGVALASCGQFRFKICLDPNGTGPSYARAWVAVYLTDSKAHPAPESIAVNNDLKGCAA